MKQDDLLVLQQWKNAPPYAFGMKGETGVVSQANKDAFWRIFDELRQAGQRALERHPQAANFKLKAKEHSHLRGSRGHAPKDLWVSICSKDAKAFGDMPQVYAIASHRGLEIGFAASIHESDYFDVETKKRNRGLIPLINGKLPSAASTLTQQIDAALSKTGGWVLNTKTRLTLGDEGYDAFPSVAELFSYLKSSSDKASGGGVICKVIPIDSVEQIDVDQLFTQALQLFAPLLASCAPSPWDVAIIDYQEYLPLAEALVEEDTFDPSSPTDGALKTLAMVKRRQGQSAFRSKLIKAYGGACAISGESTESVLQAAHIKPYDGDSTNHVQNGILLRADLHTLFDLKLIVVDPLDWTVRVSDQIRGTSYYEYDGKPFRLPVVVNQRPSPAALLQHAGSGE